LGWDYWKWGKSRELKKSSPLLGLRPYSPRTSKEGEKAGSERKNAKLEGNTGRT